MKTGKYYYSRKHKKNVYIAELKKFNGPFCDCDLCDKPVKNFYSVDIDGYEWTIGTECIKKLQLEEAH